ncbi:DEKNAAC100478 [Brettanomyces naardenensis]|uniref:DEKNAAC100478 n=1 Tax=Brettanomyces naardenensis TaxID=13370 RepID=A0A448YFX2_BRENA|nr:DEKNAAC100478 [Brettanomyces naardenensis]
MTISFLPGEPNRSPEACSFVNWNSIQILAYCSGNNLVLLTKNGHHLQTIYLPADAFAVDINSVNGKIALAIKDELYIYTPTVSNFYSFNFGGRKDLDELGIQWSLEAKLKNEKDATNINCISWSDSCEIKTDELASGEFLSLPPEFHSETTCELVAGSDQSLTLWRLYYKPVDGKSTIHKKMLWHKDQPNSVHMVKFSPNASCIVSTGFCDRLVKLWYRLSFGIETAEFELYYIPHPTVVTSLRWKTYPIHTNSAYGSIAPSRTGSQTPFNLDMVKASNGIVKLDLSKLGGSSSERHSLASLTSDRKQHNILYTVSADSVLRVFSTYKLDSGFEVYLNGSIDLYDGEPDAKREGIKKFVSFIDNSVAEYGINKTLQLLEGDGAPLDSATPMGKRGDISCYEYETDPKFPATGSGLFNQSQDLQGLLQENVEICLVFDSASNCKLYCLGNLGQPVPKKMTVYRMNQKFDRSGKSMACDIVFGDHCMPCDSRSLVIHHLLLSKYSSETELTMAVQDLFKNTIRIVAFTFKDIFQFNVNYPDRNSNDQKSLVSGFAPVKTVKIGVLQDKLTGHNKSIRRLIRSTDGSSLLSATRFNENFLWFIIPLGHGRTTLNKKSTILTPSPIIEAAIWKKGDYVLTLVAGKLICYDCRLQAQYHEKVTKLAPAMCSLPADTSETPMCFFLLPELAEDKCHMVAVYKDKRCKAWEALLTDNGNRMKISEFRVDGLPGCDGDSLHLVSAIDPVGWTASVDSIGRDVLASVTVEGFVRIYFALVTDTEVIWYLKTSFMTGIEDCSFLSGSSVNKLAIAGKGMDNLTIWDTRLGTQEYEEDFETDTIKDIDWTATLYHQAILSVGFSSYALLYTQLRYDYTNQTPTFAKIKKVSIAEQTTHSIGDSTWMSDGMLVMGVGNQFYISDKLLDANTDIITSRAIGTLEIVSNDLFHLCSALNGPLPLYHPQFIIQVLLTGRFTVIEVILVRLSKILRELDLGHGRSIDASLNLDYEDLIISQDDSKNKDSSVYDQVFDTTGESGSYKHERFTSETADILIEKLQKYKLPYLTGHQQITLSYTINIMKDILLRLRGILDYNALRFYLGLRLFHVNVSKSADPQTRATKTITMRDVTFAMHSDNKDLLFNIINEQAGLKLDWLNAKRYGISYWLNLQKLTEAMEMIARNEFFKFEQAHDGKKDPSRCAIFYLALKKKQILFGLWKTAVGHPEQAKMIKFLSHDFEDERWKKAASKNAYVLMAKHRYLDAAYFFLLADSVNDCVDVIVQKMDDVALAVAVSRTYEQSDHGESLKRILIRNVLPKAIDDNDRWYLSWCFWVFRDRRNAIQSLIKPIEEVIEDITRVVPEFKMSKSSDIHKINSVKNEDPVLLVMYQSLRNRNVKYFQGAKELSPGVEFDFVIKAATMYQNMGCDWISLFTTRNWKFVSDRETGDQEAKKMLNTESVNEGPTEVPGILDEYTSPLPEKEDKKVDELDKKVKRTQPHPSAFAEPDMSAFDFGF